MERISSKFIHILLLSEHLRARLHAERNPEMIKDRRYHLRMYQSCFVGKDVVDWLVKHGEAPSRFAAVQCMYVLQENNILHHGKVSLIESLANILLICLMIICCILKSMFANILNSV